jgi:hypothetical protein
MLNFSTTAHCREKNVTLPYIQYSKKKQEKYHVISCYWLNSKRFVGKSVNFVTIRLASLLITDCCNSCIVYVVVTWNIWYGRPATYSYQHVVSCVLFATNWHLISKLYTVDISSKYIDMKRIFVFYYYFGLRFQKKEKIKYCGNAFLQHCMRVPFMATGKIKRKYC